MTNDLKPLEDRRKGYTPPEEALRIVEGMETKQEQPDGTEQKDGTEHTEPDMTTPITITPGFSIEDLSDRYRLHNITYNEELWIFDWFKELLYKGMNATPKGWIEMTKHSKKRVPDAPMYHSSCTALYHNKDHPDTEQKSLVEKVRQMFWKDFEEHHMTTSTRAVYRQTGKDIITHNKGYNNERTTNENIIGPDGYINAGSGFEDTINALLGTTDLAETEQVYEWITGKKTYLYRISSKPGVDDERAVVLGPDGSNWFTIDAYELTFNLNMHARGVIAYRAKDFNKR